MGSGAATRREADEAPMVRGNIFGVLWHASAPLQHRGDSVHSAKTKTGLQGQCALVTQAVLCNSRVTHIITVWPHELLTYQLRTVWWCCGPLWLSRVTDS